VIHVLDDLHSLHTHASFSFLTLIFSFPPPRFTEFVQESGWARTRTHAAIKLATTGSPTQTSPHSMALQATKEQVLIASAQVIRTGRRKKMHAFWRMLKTSGSPSGLLVLACVPMPSISYLFHQFPPLWSHGAATRAASATVC
jgi:hypothetical protein